jgi:hypothetical protein
MKYIIIDYKKLTPELLTMLVSKYPDGYGDDDVITFKNHKQETIVAIEVINENTKYLVKISKKLCIQMESFNEYDYSEKEMEDPDALPEIILEDIKNVEDED